MMNNIINFCSKYFENNDFNLEELPQDASKRKFYRVKFDDLGQKNTTYIIMYSPSDLYDIRQFILVQNIMKNLSISVPEIFAISDDKNFILMEDFGDLKLNNIMNDTNEEEYYSQIIEVLAHFHSNFTNLIQNSANLDQNSDIYFLNSLNNIKIISLNQNSEIRNSEISSNQVQNIDVVRFEDENSVDGKILRNRANKNSFIQLLVEELDVFTQFYPMNFRGKNFSVNEKIFINNNLKDLLSRLPNLNITLNHADFHVDNLLFLKYRSQIKKIGIIDFQDAFYGYGVYDVVSLLQDARREVNPDLATKMLKLYSKKTKIDYKNIELAYHILGIQRNLRIIGVFCRKFIIDKDPKYLKYIGLVNNYINISSKFWFYHKYCVSCFRKDCG